MPQNIHYIVFARYPALNKVKTRLARELGAQQALELYTGMMLDIVERLLARTTVTVYVYPAADLPNFERLILAELGAHSRLTFRQQKGENLGDQMLNAFREQEEQKQLPAIIIGTDSPSLPDEYLQMAEDELANKQAVIGACEDGGFYLLGLHAAHSSAFFGEDYSHNQVYQNTLDALQSCCADLTETPLWFDIDYLADLERLHAELNAADSGAYTPRRTHSLLNELFKPSNSTGA